MCIKFETIKSQVRRAVGSGKIQPEVRALFQALLALFELLVSVLIEGSSTN